MDAALRVESLRKTYKDVVAVAGIDLEVAAGECFGLLGPNGAGKTTTVEICEGLTVPDSGQVEVLGLGWATDARQLRQRLGIQLQETQVSDKLTVIETLRLFRSFFDRGMSAAQAMGLVRLEEKRDARVGALSGGQKQRLALACALVGDPELLFLDEPTTGLDPQARVMIWKRLLDLKRHGKTLLLTTHYMDEAQRLCDEIIVIDHGRILDRGAPRDLIDRHVKGHVFEVQKPLPSGWRDGRWEHEDIGDAILYYVETPRPFTEDLPEDAVYWHRQANLEDVFLRLTGRQLREN